VSTLAISSPDAMLDADLQPVTLSHAEPFAIGGRRLCFVHPRNPSLCIKVNRTDDQRFLRLPKRRIVPARFLRELDDNEHDRRVLSSLQRRLGPRFAHLPRYHGDIDTDLGRAVVLDLVRDADGRISRTVRALICEGVPLDALRPAFNAFAQYLVRYNVLTRALLDHNIAARHAADGSWSLVLIDGYGDPAAIPLASLVPPIGRARMRRRAVDAWERFERLASADPSEREFDTSRWSQGFLNHRGVDPSNTND
jgi:hypothetical protein